MISTRVTSCDIPATSLRLRFLSKVCSAVFDLDAARILYARNFASDKIDQTIAEMKKKAIYTHRCKTMYDKMFAMPVDALHRQARDLGTAVSQWGLLMSINAYSCFENFQDLFHSIVSHSSLAVLDVSGRFDKVCLDPARHN